MPLTIVANIHAKPGKEALIRAALEKLIEPSRADAGCIPYDLHIDHEDPGHFMFFENWESQDLWQAHMATPHLADYKQATDGAVDRFTLHEMEKVG